jgi:hypothetical protein
MLPAKEDTYQLSPKEDTDDIYIRPLAAAKIRLRAVQKFGLNPLDAKRAPILSSLRPKDCLSLFSTFFVLEVDILNSFRICSYLYR